MRRLHQRTQPDRERAGDGLSIDARPGQAPPGQDRPEPGLLHVVTALPPAVLGPEDLSAVAGLADLIELRLDRLPEEVSIAAWIAAAPRPVLVTVRSTAQGGAFRGSSQAAAALLREAAQAGAAWLDVEEDVAPHLDDLPPSVRLVASVHGTPDMSASWALAEPRFARIKIARPCDDSAAFEALRQEARGADPRCFFVPYGRLAATRTLFSHDRAFVFGAAAADAPAAAGQPTLAVLLAELRPGEITAGAALYGLVGRPPARSPSPAIHNACFRTTARDALYVALDDISLDEAVGLPFDGLSITMPDKAHAYRFADEHDEAARATGVVNTLVRSAVGWSGHNTDVEALRQAAGEPKAGADGAFVYGAGGYARAAVVALKQAGWRVRIAARRERAALTVAETFDVAFAGSELYERQATDGLVVQTTPAGVDGAPLPAFAGADLRDLRVLDAPYGERGRDTGLVAQARAQGAGSIVGGRDLLAAQALGQARLFAVDSFEARATARAIALVSDAAPSLVLVGPRGAGKSTVGRRVARALGRPFVDLDDEVLRTTGRPPAAWIEDDGWEAFRAVEQDALTRVLARTGLVLATGAGVVEVPENRALLAQEEAVVFLDVPPEACAARVERDATPRPRLPGATGALDEAQRSRATRAPWWRDAAGSTVDGSGALDEVVQRVLAVVTHGPRAETRRAAEQDTMNP